MRLVTRLRPPALPPSCSARHPHSRRLLSRVCRMSCLQHAPVRPSLHLLAVPALRTCHRPLRPCRPAAVARPYARLRDCVRPPLHLLAAPVTRTRTVLLAVSVSSARARPPAPLPSRSARHPHLHRPVSRVCIISMCLNRHRLYTWRLCHVIASST